MKINLIDLKQTSELNIIYKEDESIREISRASEIDSREPVSTKLKIFLAGSDVLVEGKVRVNLNLSCSRCLENFEYSLVTKFKTEIPLKQIDSQSWQWEPTEEIRQALVIALPLKPLCKKDCNGLCIKCGMNLNYGQCDCKKEVFDDRWSKLKLLMEKKNAKS